MGSTLPASRDEDAQLLLDKVGSVRAGGGPPLATWDLPPELAISSPSHLPQAGRNLDEGDPRGPGSLQSPVQ